MSGLGADARHHGFVCCAKKPAFSEGFWLGARIQTWEWRNQNPPFCLPFNAHSEKSTKFDPFQSIGWMLIQNAPPLRKPCGAPLSIAASGVLTSWSIRL